MPHEIHAVRVGYFNADHNNCVCETIIYADGYNESNATEFQYFELAGSATQDQAVNLAKYYIIIKNIQEVPECKHDGGSMIGYDHVKCRKCGMIKTDSCKSSWGIAASKWFKSYQEAEFYAANGRLPK
jgi:hypothetical protein